MIKLKLILSSIIFFTPFMSVSAYFREELVDENFSTQKIGVGSDGSVFLSKYNSHRVKLMVFKELDERFQSLHRTWTDYLSRQSSSLTNEICANAELFGSSLIANVFGVFLKPITSSKAMVDDSRVIFAMQPILGGNLREMAAYLENNPKYISVLWIKLVLARLSLGLEYIHQKGWVWGDVASRNVLIDRDSGYPVISDFGRSKRITKNSDSAIQEWYDLGIIASTFSDLVKEHISNNSSRKDLEDAVKQFTKSSQTQVPLISSLKDVKNLSLFKDFDWDAVEDGTMLSPFVPKNNVNYLKFLNKNIDKKSEEMIQHKHVTDNKTFDRFVLSESFLKKVNTENVEKIKSTQDYCNTESK